MHDVLDARDQVPDEAEQLLHSGYDADALLERARAAAADGNASELAAISDELKRAPRNPDWAFVEPDDDTTLDELAAQAPTLPLDSAQLGDRIHGAWLGRCVANTMGKPVEGLTPTEVEIYLRAVGQWPQRGYLPLLPELPDGVSHLHESAPFASAGTFEDVPRDDDLDWTILGLAMLEEHGVELTTTHIAAAWLDRLPFTQTFTAERVAYRNLVRGIPVSLAASVDNPYREWIGALIRADIFGYTNPGRPGEAARRARVDARLSHVQNGLYGELWAAALIASALAATDTATAVESALTVVPATSRLAMSQREILALRAAGARSDDALAWVTSELGHYNWVHTVNNAALISIGLLWGRDFVDSVALTISGGRDTDSSAATVGSAYGAVHGRASIPEELVGTTHVRVRSAVRGFDRVEISRLAERTLSVIGAQS